MSYEVQIRRAAELDVAEAQLWYETQRGGLGAEFHSEVSQVIDRLAETPLIYQVSYTRIFAGQLFIVFLISCGSEFLVKLSLFSPAHTAEKIPRE